MTPRTDTCPACGTRRYELVIVPGRFHCARCGAATPGPVEASHAPAGAQLTLDTDASS